MSWDERYSTAEYVYGTEPNGFLVEHAGLLRGPVLSLAEGEGRNGVFLAGQGLTVHGVDSSAVGLAKAQALAAARGVSLHVEQADLAEFCPPVAGGLSAARWVAAAGGVFAGAAATHNRRAKRPGFTDVGRRHPVRFCRVGACAAARVDA